MLEKIKILLGVGEDDESKDDILNVLVSICKDEAREYCNLAEYTNKLDSAVISMVIERYNDMGTEGISSVSTSGIREEYLDGYSKNVINKLVKQRKVRLVK